MYMYGLGSTDFVQGPLRVVVSKVTNLRFP
jgi:hypothetical protein